MNISNSLAEATQICVFWCYVSRECVHGIIQIKLVSCRPITAGVRSTHTWQILTFFPKISIIIFTHLKLGLATATHNFKWVKITYSCLIWGETFANFDI